MGLAVMSLIFVTWLPLVHFLLVLVGALAGFFVVADERAVTASRPCAAVRRAFDPQCRISTKT